MAILVIYQSETNITFIVQPVMVFRPRTKQPGAFVNHLPLNWKLLLRNKIRDIELHMLRLKLSIA